MGFRSLLFLAGIMTLLLPARALAQTIGPGTGIPAEVINQARKALAIAPADNTPLTLGATRSIYNGGSAACNIAVILADDTAAVTLLNIPVGTFLPVRAKVVMATNTTCTGIIGLW